MIRNQSSNRLFAQVSDAYQLHSIYRPVQWRAKDVLSDNRKAVIRKRYLNRILLAMILLLSVLTLVFLSTVETKQSASGIVDQKTVIPAANQAYFRGNYLKAQEVYRQAIQAGHGTNEIWLNYDRSLLMKTFKALEADSTILQPATSNRIEQNVHPQPADPVPDSEYMTDEEWQRMKQDAYEWLGC